MIKHLKIQDSFPYTIDFSKVKSISDGRYVYEVIHDGTDNFGSCNVEISVDENKYYLAKINEMEM